MRFTDLPLELRIAVRLLLPALATAVARRRGISAGVAMALTTAVALSLYALWLEFLLPASAPLSQARWDGSGDTYYALRQSPVLWMLAPAYLLIAGPAALTHRLIRCPALPPAIAFWLFHLGVPASIFPPSVLAPLLAMPRHCADYPEVFALWSRVSMIGTLAVWSALLLLLGVLAVAAIRTLSKP